MSAQVQPQEMKVHREVDFDRDLVKTTSTAGERTPVSKYAVQRATDKSSGPAMQSVYIAETISVTNSFNF